MFGSRSSGTKFMNDFVIIVNKLARSCTLCVCRPFAISDTENRTNKSLENKPNAHPYLSCHDLLDDFWLGFDKFCKREKEPTQLSTP